MRHVMVGAVLLAALAGLASPAAPTAAQTNYSLLKITTSPAEDTHPTWTPDGLSLIFETNRDGAWGLYRIDLPTRTLTPLTPQDGWNRRMPEVSHDGHWIVFCRLGDNNMGNLYKMPLDGGDEIEVTPYLPYLQQARPTWSLDDQTIYYSFYSTLFNDFDIYSVPASGGPGTPHYATSVRETFPVVMKDGLHLAFAHQFTPGVYNAGMSALDDPYNVQQLTFNAENTTITDFNADAKRILYVARVDWGRLELFERNIVTGVDRRMTEEPTPGLNPETHYAVYSPTSDRIAFSSRRETGENNIWLLDYLSVTGVPDGGVGAAALNLTARPNPMLTTTTVSVDLTAPSQVGVRIFDLRGALVRTLLAESALDAGPRAWNWDGRDDAGRPLSAGSYFVRVAADDRIETRKIQLIR